MESKQKCTEINGTVNLDQFILFRPLSKSKVLCDAVFTSIYNSLFQTLKYLESGKDIKMYQYQKQKFFIHYLLQIYEQSKTTNPTTYFQDQSQMDIQ